MRILAQIVRSLFDLGMSLMGLMGFRGPRWEWKKTQWKMSLESRFASWEMTERGIRARVRMCPSCRELVDRSLSTCPACGGSMRGVAGGGMGQALVRAKEITEKDFHVVFTMQMAIGCVLYTVFYSIAPYFAHWFGDPLYEDLLRVSATYFLLRPFSNMYNSWLQREMHYKQQSIRRVVLSIFTSILTATAAWAGMGVWSLVLGGLIGTMLSIVVLRAITPYRPQLYFDPTIAKRHSSYGAKIAAIDVITYLKNQAPNIIISRISGAHLVGLFNKADSMAKIPFAAVNGPIYQPVFRSLSIAQDNPDQAKYIFFRTISLLAVYTLPLYIGLAWCSTPLISFLYGSIAGISKMLFKNDYEPCPICII